MPVPGKSKFMVISPVRRLSVQHCEFVVEGKPMEFVSSYVHLVTYYQIEEMTFVIFLKGRSDFVGQVNIFLCYFKMQCSDVKYKLFQPYCASFMDVSCGTFMQ